MHSLLNSEDKIEWNPAYSLEILEDKKKLLLYSEWHMVTLKGEAYLLLAPFLMQGAHSASELVDLLQPELSAEIVYYALTKLETKQYIQAKNPSLPYSLAAFSGLLKTDGNTAWKRLQTTPVYIHDTTNEWEERLKATLSALSIRVVATKENAAISIMAVKDYLDPAVRKFQSDKPWILFKPYGSQIWLGPILGNETRVCSKCLISHIQQNRLESNIIKDEEREAFFQPISATLKTTQELALNLIAIELFKWIITGKNEQLDGKLQTLNLLELKTQEHFAPLLFSCIHGQKSPASNFEVIDLKSRQKREGYRCSTSEETLEKYSHLVSPITGKVQILEACKEKIGSTTHVYQSGANWAVKRFAGARESMRNYREMSSGKGTTDSAAKAGALCEALERMSGIARGCEEKVYSTWQDISDKAIHPQYLLHFSANQYKNREANNPEAHAFSKVENPFSEDDIVAWTPVWSLTSKCIKYVPLSYCYYTYQGNDHEWFCHADSNGCAAGNCVEEALLQGFFELVERDCVAIWWYNRISYPQVNLGSFSNPYIQTFIKDYANNGRDVHVLDITNDLKIPTFVALSRCTKGKEKICMGFGTHLDVESAILRALTEMNQFASCPSFWEREADEDDPQETVDLSVVKNWMNTATYDNQSHLKGVGTKDASSYEKWNTFDLLEDITHCRKTVENLGYELLVLDQTREDIGLNVVRVMVPGLRHFWSRLAPGRLYDVPVKMGKLKAPLKEEELNPIPIFL